MKILGSYGEDTQTEYSDIDIDYKKFSGKYFGDFSKLVRIDSIKDELKMQLKKDIDLVPDTNKFLKKDIIYV